VGCAAGLAMVELMEGGLLARGVALGDYMGSTLEVSERSPPSLPHLALGGGTVLLRVDGDASMATGELYWDAEFLYARVDTLR